MSATWLAELSPLESARWVVEEEARLFAAAHRQEGQRLWMAFVLAPRVEVADALLRGESVPLDQLDREWVARFGLVNAARGRTLA